MNIKDKDIIQAIREKTEKGFRLLMLKYKQPIYWHIRRLVIWHDEAEDATQETFIRVFKSFDNFKNDDSFRAWIYRIATNEALRQIDSRKTEQVPLEVDADEANHMMADSYIDYSNLEAVKLQKAIHSLPIKQQTTFCLRYYDELSYDEIAAATNSTASSAKANYHIAKEKIVSYMKSND